MERTMRVKIKVDMKTTFNNIKASLLKMCEGNTCKIIDHTDVFYFFEHELQLRRYDDGRTELMKYKRNTVDMTISHYSVDKIDEKYAYSLSNKLKSFHKVKAIIRKKRSLYVYKNAHIYMDEVYFIGDFIQIKVILNNDQESQEGIDKINDILKILNLDRSLAIKDSYLQSSMLIKYGQKANATIWELFCKYAPNDVTWCDDFIKKGLYMRGDLMVLYSTWNEGSFIHGLYYYDKDKDFVIEVNRFIRYKEGRNIICMTTRVTQKRLVLYIYLNMMLMNVVINNKLLYMCISLLNYLNFKTILPFKYLSFKNRR